MIDILAISHACVTAINRVIYREFQKAGWNIELVIPEALSAGPGFHRAADPSQPGDPPIHHLQLRGDNQRLMTYRGLLRLLEARRPKIILLDMDPGSLVALEVGTWAKARGSHLVCQSCENMERRLSDRLRRKQYTRALRDVAISGLVQSSRAVVDHVFAISNDGVQVLRNLGFRSVSKIPLGSDERLFVPNAAARESTRHELGLTQFTFAYFGRLLEQKGVHLLIEALSQLQDRPWQLLLDRFSENRDPYVDRLHKQLNDTGVIKRVIYFDAKHEEMPRFMNAADVVVMPSIETESWKEQYGRVAPEAMACGRLVMASNSGALPELVADAGIVFAEGDVGAIRTRLVRVMDRPELVPEVGAKATERAHRHLTVTAQRALMEERFRALLQIVPAGKSSPVESSFENR